MKTVPPPSSWSFFPGENVEVGLGYGQGTRSSTYIVDEVHPLFCEVASLDGENTLLEAVPMIHLRKKFTVGDLVKICQSVPPIKGVQHLQIPNSVVCTVEIKLVPIAGLEGFVSASNTKHVEVWIPELELVLNIDHNCLHYQPNLTALGEVRKENPPFLAEHSATFFSERTAKHLDLTKLSPNLKPNGPLPITPHTGASPWKDLRVCVVGGTELDQWGRYKPVELIKGLCCTVLDVKVDFATHSGLAVLVRPDGRSTTSWVDYSRLRHDDNRCFLHKDQHGSSRPLHYSFKRGYVPSYSDQELLALNGYLNPEYKTNMAQAHRQREEEEQRKEGIETGDGEYLVSKEANVRTSSWWC